jgi:hypothetical protein
MMLGKGYTSLFMMYRYLCGWDSFSNIHVSICWCIWIFEYYVDKAVDTIMMLGKWYTYIYDMYKDLYRWYVCIYHIYILYDYIPHPYFTLDLTP